MAKYSPRSIFWVSHILIFKLALCYALAHEARKVHIIYMGSLFPGGEHFPSSHKHMNILQKVLNGSSVEDSFIRSYQRSFNGFAARLTEHEKQSLTSMREVVSVFPSRTLQLQTTRSWDFLGFPETIHQSFNVGESDVIIGTIDSGIWPESESFNDDGFGPVPSTWKGVCHGGENFTCNKKLIGARSYVNSGVRDQDGHGTHTASTAAGRIVTNVSFYGLAQGSARGGMPFARIASYKVCGDEDEGCTDAGILAAFDDAIADGVDIITISIGGDSPVHFDVDVVSIGSFHAMEKGILTVQSAGNSYEPGSADGVAPWLFSVAASSTDRSFIDKVVLGDGRMLNGSSVNPFILEGDEFPLIHGKDASTRCTKKEAGLCSENCLDNNLVAGKIVVCDSEAGADEAIRAGAVGSILRYEEVDPLVQPLPAAGLKTPDYNSLMSYVNSTRTAMAKILRSEIIEDPAAPIVANFSSRGPNTIAADILKPDISAPGVDILAAYSPMGKVTASPQDKRSVKYSILSGTSMSCPHVAGAAAYVKSLHPDWSPAAIKSALMTTARPMNPDKNPDREFAYGSGQIDPIKAANPGLVYDATVQDHIRFLCSLGYNHELRNITGDSNSTCLKDARNISSPKDVNYPSMAAMVARKRHFSIRFERTVTNVGFPNSTYVGKVESDPMLKVGVEPSTLSFESLQEKKSFNVNVSGEIFKSGSLVSASLVWSDGIYSVRSPIVIYTIS